ncbi:hypothetical protein BGZ61DRAFT_568715 [Ilyonectria robusta]|uniref:uncharacterized protein n=1 Tax=Ilyonectria robusta TaxID=1079257 RepID=UPI001E8D95C7|nr:uncharacterized protein BGZ61DRAFT_568715 [Ilyonectria robusta]KAH8729151.1 hypothetical protein BGZ61DRAFT_568715 [Ilyonectria robusta]
MDQPHCVIFPCTCHAMQALQEGGLSRAGLLSCLKRGGGLVVKSINAWVEVPQLGGFDQGISWYRKPGPVAGTGARAGTGHLTMGYLLRSTRSTWDDPLTCRPGSPRRPGTASKHILGCPPPHAAHAPKTPWCQAHNRACHSLWRKLDILPRRLTTQLPAGFL